MDEAFSKKGMVHTLCFAMSVYCSATVSVLIVSGRRGLVLGGEDHAFSVAFLLFFLWFLIFTLTLRNQTWLSGKWTIEISDVPNKTIQNLHSVIFQAVMFDKIRW